MVPAHLLKNSTQGISSRQQVTNFLRITQGEGIIVLVQLTLWYLYNFELYVLQNKATIIILTKIILKKY